MLLASLCVSIIYFLIQIDHSTVKIDLFSRVFISTNYRFTLFSHCSYDAMINTLKVEIFAGTDYRGAYLRKNLFLIDILLAISEI